MQTNDHSFSDEEDENCHINSLLDMFLINALATKDAGVRFQDNDMERTVSILEMIDENAAHPSIR